MSKRVFQINELLRKEIAFIIEREIELPDVLATVTKVDCSPDLAQAKVWISVLPDAKMGSTIEKLRKRSGLIRSFLKKKVVLKILPKLNFVIDDTEKHAAEIEETLEKIKENNA